MRKILITLAALVASGPAWAASEDFCDGYQRAYAAAYIEATRSQERPAKPMCPEQPAKAPKSPVSDYDQGYTLGVADGQAAGARFISTKR